jgi:hypothetical protein
MCAGCRRWPWPRPKYRTDNYRSPHAGSAYLGPPLRETEWEYYQYFYPR